MSSTLDMDINFDSGDVEDLTDLVEAIYNRRVQTPGKLFFVIFDVRPASSAHYRHIWWLRFFLWVNPRQESNPGFLDRILT